MTITAIYIRVSKEEQVRKGLSLEAQKDKGIVYCKENNIKDYKIYEDAGFSGGSIKRPTFIELMNDIKLKKINRVVVYKADRLSRDVVTLIRTIEEFRWSNVDFVSLTEPIDTTTAMGEAFFTMIGLFAQLERKLVKERVSLVHENKIAQGKFVGRAPLGYKFDEKKNVIIDEENAEKIRTVFDMWVKGIHYKKIHQKTKIPIPSIYDIIKNPTYIGYIELNRKEKDREGIIRKEEKIIYKGNFENIIDIKTFKKINPNFEIPNEANK